jgi:hypothetical protein
VETFLKTKQKTSSASTESKEKMMDYELKEFDEDIFIQWFTEEARNGRMPAERMQEPNWGEALSFLLTLLLMLSLPDRAKWMQPL